MLDIVTSDNAASKAKAKGGDIWSTHHDIGDFSLYTKFTRGFQPIYEVYQV
jgi:hypothetical protein